MNLREMCSEYGNLMKLAQEVFGIRGAEISGSVTV